VHCHTLINPAATWSTDSRGAPNPPPLQPSASEKVLFSMLFAGFTTGNQTHCRISHAASGMASSSTACTHLHDLVHLQLQQLQLPGHCCLHISLCCVVDAVAAANNVQHIIVLQYNHPGNTGGKHTRGKYTRRGRSNTNASQIHTAAAGPCCVRGSSFEPLYGRTTPKFKLSSASTESREAPDPVKNWQCSHAATKQVATNSLTAWCAQSQHWHHWPPRPPAGPSSGSRHTGPAAW